MSQDRASGSVALVLGSGGVLGGAFHAGVVKALLDTRGIDARGVDVIVGTSAGALSAVLLGAGLHPDDLYRRETGQQLSPEGQRLFGDVRARLGPHTPHRSSFGPPFAPMLPIRALLEPGSVAPGTVAASLLPRGVVPADRLRDLVDALTFTRRRGSSSWAWPGRPFLEVCAVDMTSGRRRVFDGAGEETIGAAVAASCAVPGVVAPVRIGERDYLDGGVHSADNVDVLAGRSFDQVIISSPLSTERIHDVSSPWHGIRVLTRWQTDADVRRLDAGAVVEVLRPTARDLYAMGPDMLDGRRRAAVALQAYTSAAAALSEACPAMA